MNGDRDKDILGSVIELPDLSTETKSAKPKKIEARERISATLTFKERLGDREATAVVLDGSRVRDQATGDEFLSAVEWTHFWVHQWNLYSVKRSAPNQATLRRSYSCESSPFWDLFHRSTAPPPPLRDEASAEATPVIEKNREIREGPALHLLTEVDTRPRSPPLLRRFDYVDHPMSRYTFTHELEEDDADDELSDDDENYLFPEVVFTRRRYSEDDDTLKNDMRDFYF